MNNYSINGIREDIKRMGKLATIRLQDSLRAFEALDLQEANRIIDADDVFDVLKLSIEDKSNYLLSMEPEVTEGRFLRSAQRVGANLEHIGDAACHIAKCVDIAHDENLELVDFDLDRMEEIDVESVERSLESYHQRDMQLVESACLHEPQQDSLYRSNLARIQQRMKNEPQHVSFLFLWHMVMKYLERVCDYTLNIGEQAIFLATGRRLKFTQYQQLDRLMGTRVREESRFSPYYDGLSGAIVARLETEEEVLLYKEGSKRKIEEETAKLKKWKDILPQVTPQVIETESEGDRETLLREFISGTLLSELYLKEDNFAQKEKATNILCEILRDVWEMTIKRETPTVDYVQQIRSRLGEVYAMHPELGEHTTQGELEGILDEAEKKQGKLAPNFSVWLHGDFNMDNIFYNDEQIKFIDVHRSHYGDYLVDIGVFLISTIRQPNLPEPVRDEMKKVRSILLETAKEFGKENGDETFSKRLALTLSRSYITSSRIILEESHARWLFEHGINLLKSVVKQ